MTIIEFILYLYRIATRYSLELYQEATNNNPIDYQYEYSDNLHLHQYGQLIA